MTKVYLAGDMLPKGSQLLRALERDQIKEIGLDLYVPQDNKEINDKANAVQEGLAERIVRHDTDAIKESDVVVIEPQPFALGTLTELGQIHGMKMLAKMILDLAVNESGEMSTPEVLNHIIQLAEKVDNQKVFPHFQDIRRVKGATETEDRRSWSINQYVYGVCLDLTDGKGLYEWEEVLEELKKIKSNPTLQYFY